MKSATFRDYIKIVTHLNIKARWGFYFNKLSKRFQEFKK